MKPLHGYSIDGDIYSRTRFPLYLIKLYLEREERDIDYAELKSIFPPKVRGEKYSYPIFATYNEAIKMNTSVGSCHKYFHMYMNDEIYLKDEVIVVSAMYWSMDTVASLAEYGELLGFEINKVDRVCYPINLVNSISVSLIR